MSLGDIIVNMESLPKVILLSVLGLIFLSAGIYGLYLCIVLQGFYIGSYNLSLAIGGISVGLFFLASVLASSPSTVPTLRAAGIFRTLFLTLLFLCFLGIVVSIMNLFMYGYDECEKKGGVPQIQMGVRAGVHNEPRYAAYRSLEHTWVVCTFGDGHQEIVK